MGTIAAAVIMARVGCLGFFLYPRKYLKRDMGSGIADKQKGEMSAETCREGTTWPRKN